MISVQGTIAGRGVSRRDFLRLCTMMAGVLALPKSYSKFLRDTGSAFACACHLVGVPGLCRM